MWKTSIMNRHTTEKITEKIIACVEASVVSNSSVTTSNSTKWKSVMSLRHFGLMEKETGFNLSHIAGSTESLSLSQTVALPFSSWWGFHRHLNSIAVYDAHTGVECFQSCDSTVATNSMDASDFKDYCSIYFNFLPDGFKFIHQKYHLTS